MSGALPNDAPPLVYAPKRVEGVDPVQAWNDYQKEYDRSINDPAYWAEQATKYLKWSSPFSTVNEGDFIDGDMRWFTGGKLNACYNCIDRHLPERGDQVAIVWEADEMGEGQSITYNELAKEVSRIANALKMRGVKKGDVVTIYMPMIPEAAMVMLACTRIGAVHSVVFAGFSADALRDRIRNCNSRFVVTADEGKRGGRVLGLKALCDGAVKQCPDVDTVFVVKYTGSQSVADSMDQKRDVYLHELTKLARPYCPVEPMDSEDDMFILYTSGSTGQPKGVVHTTAGYCLHAALTTHRSFDLREEDVFCCAADCGWITGHTYTVYGPLLNGATTVMFESIPTYPNPYRYWDLVQRHKVTQFYTAPTALRALMRFDSEPIKDYDLSSLRVLGSVGEPINPEVWKWYYEKIGKEKVTVVDTYWQTETGGHIGCSIPGVVPMKPGSCGLPYFGMDFAVLDALSGEELHGDEVEGLLCLRKPWPSMARSVRGDHDRFMNVYLRPYKGYYFTGDGVRKDKDGFYWITGRVDDVINPSGHRLGTAEIESALVACDEVSEAAVVGFPHPVKGDGIGCFVILKEGISPEDDPELTNRLKKSVRTAISPIATPDLIVYCDLPKTRSGKIMRRILRKVAAGEEDSIGDTSTLADPAVVDTLIQRFKDAKNSAGSK